MPIVIWWGSPCRAIMPVFRELARTWNAPIKVIACNALSNSRQSMGWNLPDLGRAELVTFKDGLSSTRASEIVKDNADSFHLVGSYQKAVQSIESSIHACIEASIPFGVMSEAPLNMLHGPMRPIKELYLTKLLPQRVKATIQHARFIANLSGSDPNSLIQLGWPARKIHPFGYYPELDYKQNEREPTPTDIICLGLQDHFKGADVLLRAVAIAKRDGNSYNVTITGDGNRKRKLESLARSLRIDTQIDFCGLVSREELERRWRGARILVAPGRYEPWGIRVNESILKGVPVVCSNGLGASELVEESGAGLVFETGDTEDLANCFTTLLRNEETRLECHRRALDYSTEISPKAAAERLKTIVSEAITSIN